MDDTDCRHGKCLVEHIVVMDDYGPHDHYRLRDVPILGFSADRDVYHHLGYRVWLHQTCYAEPDADERLDHHFHGDICRIILASRADI